MDRDDDRAACPIQRVLREERRTLLILAAVVLVFVLVRKVVQ